MYYDFELKEYPKNGNESRAYETADRVIAMIEECRLADKCVPECLPVPVCSGTFMINTKADISFTAIIPRTCWENMIGIPMIFCTVHVYAKILPGKILNG